MYHELRAFLHQLELDGDLRRITEPLAPEPDVPALADAAVTMRGPVIVMENIQGSTGSVVVGVHATHNRIGRTLGLPMNTPVAEIVAELDRRWSNYPVPWEEVPSGPCQEVVLEGNDVDLTDLPVYRVNERDGGPYLDKPIILTRSPDDGSYNMGIYRCQFKGAKHLSIFAGYSHGPTIHFRQAESHGLDRIPVAVAIGCDPVMSLAAATPLPETWDEIAFAGALRGEPTRMTKAKTIDLMVPAYAEIILEGYISTDPATREIEGAFGEYSGHYSSTFITPKIHVTAVTRRSNPIFDQVSIGPLCETEVMTQLPFSVSILRQARQLVPELVAFYAASTMSTTSVASLRQTRGGRAKQLMAAIWGLDASTMVKHLFVVDDEIDVYDWDQVMYAFSTRFRGAIDMIMMPRTFAPLIEPTSNPRGMVTRYGFDCTLPIAPDEPLETNGLIQPRAETAAWAEWLQGKRAQAPATHPSGGHLESCPRCGEKELEKIPVREVARSFIKCSRCAFVWREGENIRLMDQDRLDTAKMTRIPWLPPPRGK